MHIEGDVITWSASDLAAATACEFGFLRDLDRRQGRIGGEAAHSDSMMERAAELGAAHEQRVLEEYRATHGTAVAEIPRPGPATGVDLAEARLATRAALASGAPVIAQAALEMTDEGDRFIGHADFLVREADGSYRVEDAKLARSAKVTALLQLAAYADALTALGATASPTVSLILGDGARRDYAVADIAPVLRLRRDRLLAIVRERETEGSHGAPVSWGDRRYGICGSCPWCELEILAHDDVLRVASLSRSQREHLTAAGITSMSTLATSPGPVPGIGRETLTKLREQARLQCQATPGEAPPFEVADGDAFRMIPAPSPGDIFFDFEGDPLYSEGSSTWGLDYLWGWVDATGSFHRLWAHDFAGEREALAAFLAFVDTRRAEHPGMHIYHYASYERTHLFAMAARWGIGEHAVDDLLRAEVLVDLYPVVKRALRVGTPSYSIKKLEPLYMGEQHREGVDNAGDSIVEYAAACAARDGGDSEEFERRIADIEQYNAYDCLSTLRLRDWLLSQAAAIGIVPDARDPGTKNPTASGTAMPVDPGPSDLEVALEARAASAANESDALAYGLAAAAVDYHRRERKTYWHDHFARLSDPKEDWTDTRDVFDVAEATLVRDWHREGNQRVRRRHVRLLGVPAPGSRFEGSRPFALYDIAPFGTNGANGERTAHGVSVLAEGADWVEIEESERDGTTWDHFPTALTPGTPPATKSIEQAITTWGQSVAASSDWPNEAASQLLLRIPPQTKAGNGLTPAPSPDDVAGPLVDSLVQIDSGYVAVQGPPGTGKTYVGSHAVAAAVTRHHWRVGVVAQSHAVVEHMLDAIVAAGLDAGRVGKVPKDPSGATSFTALPTDGHQDFAARAQGGYVIGGTVWDLTNRKRVSAGQFDLLVIDEAGQFSLADTIAAAQCASRVLLLGDPQQLPAVTQGIHPAPVDTPALEWLSAGHDVLPQEFGYFLSQSRRMDAALCHAVSELSYAGQLRAHPTTRARELAGVLPGLSATAVAHHGRSTSSPEEAAAVVRIVRDLIGTPWTDPHADPPRDAAPLEQTDFIVVTPYNAQRAEVSKALRSAGFADIRVGTVDKFQGQEAAVAIVSLAASSSDDVPRGMEFLINRNRLNVAISRAKWRAYVVYSPDLLAHMPVTPERLVELGRFARLVGR